MIKYIGTNAVRIKYISPDHADTYLLFDGSLAKFDLLSSALGTIKMNHDIEHESVFAEYYPEWLVEKIPDILHIVRAVQVRFSNLIENSPVNVYYNFKINACVENVILGGYGEEPIPKEAFFLTREYVDLCTNMKPSVELLKWYKQIEIDELLEG